MRIALPYGKEREVTIDVPDENVYFVADREDIPALRDVGEELRRLLRSPTGTPPLPELVKPGDKVVILVDDITRPTPQHVILPTLLDELNACGIPDKDIEVIIALGTHRYMDEREIRERYGDTVVERVPVINHDYKDPRNLVDMGRTESGIPVSVNKKVYDCLLYTSPSPRDRG